MSLHNIKHKWEKAKNKALTIQKLEHEQERNKQRWQELGKKVRSTAQEISTRRKKLENFLTGTPFYMAPEQVECLPVDERTDIYCLGITAFEMVTGKRPYPDKDAWTVMEMHLKIETHTSLLTSPDDIETKAKSLIQAALDAGGKDNITVAMAEI